MVIVMNQGALPEQVEAVKERLVALGFLPHPIQGVSRIVIGAVGEQRAIEPGFFENMPGVERVVPIMKPYKLASREAKGEDTVVKAGAVAVGGGSFTVMAGPCAVEGREQLCKTAHLVKRAGAAVLRGGAFKPRTSPYAFQGLEERGLKLL
ncbi:MAG: 3-deoxy-7-phosphoheptulonate synthase, partial [Desulfotomaculales bacterium]